ncbi:hypothetical protein RJ639_029245 [Escallonia herrerae]|uniref:Uncharacterized protein n=1 Tax=Escallonia herrerae TaxID=1293975 RepID=A0AA88X4M2_9ASTE|nr:hypothetical protein RJ639_029245 [Escallonia herrerae]
MIPDVLLGRQVLLIMRTTMSFVAFLDALRLIISYELTCQSAAVGIPITVAAFHLRNRTANLRAVLNWLCWDLVSDLQPNLMKQI